MAHAAHAAANHGRLPMWDRLQNTWLPRMCFLATLAVAVALVVAVIVSPWLVPETAPPHILDLFAGSKPSREQVLYFGRLLREVWAAKLAREFPDRRFVVSFPEEGCESLLDFEVSFYQM